MRAAFFYLKIQCYKHNCNAGLRRQGAKRKDPHAVLMLQYGLSNNFMNFKEAMSNKSLQEYEELGRLIEKAKIEEPKVPDQAEYRLDSSNRPTYRPREVPIHGFKKRQAKTACLHP